MLFIEMLRRAITDIFCFGAKTMGVDFFQGHIRRLNSNSQHSLHFQRKRELTKSCV